MEQFGGFCWEFPGLNSIGPSNDAKDIIPIRAIFDEYYLHQGLKRFSDELSRVLVFIFLNNFLISYTNFLLIRKLLDCN